MSVIPLLSVDGGGIRDIIAGRQMEYIETQLGEPIQTRFYMAGGASAGGLLTAGTSIVAGKPLMSSKLATDLFVNEGEDIFRKGFLARNFNINLPNLFSTRYDGKHLEAVLRDRFGNLKLSDLDSDLIVSAYDIKRRKEKLFKSWEARGEYTDVEDALKGEDPRSKDYTLFDVTRSTSAAQTYFPVHTAYNMLGEPSDLIDGGNFANNPSLLVLADAMRRFGNTHQYVVLSLGSGETERPLNVEKLRNAGIVRWASPTVDINLGSMRSHDYIMRTMLGEDYMRIQTDLRRDNPDEPGPSDDFDDASPENIARLEERAQQLIKEQKPRLDCIVEFLGNVHLKDHEELREEQREHDRVHPREPPACPLPAIAPPEGMV